MGAHWTYESSQGPEYWGDLDPVYVTCKIGRRQSPIDIVETAANLGLGPLIIKYRKGAGRVVNNGHTLQVECQKGNMLRYEGRLYELAQFHFHSPSEHLVGGRPFDMEAHLVHRDAEERLAVIGVFMQEGMEHPLLTELWRAAPDAEGAARSVANIDPGELIPVDGHFYAYSGSLTTPPCTEDVQWIVMKTPLAVSPEQIEQFVALIGHNARPVQAINERIVEEF
jgi:carbonic anhydrase